MKRLNLRRVRAVLLACIFIVVLARVLFWAVIIIASVLILASYLYPTKEKKLCN